MKANSKIMHFKIKVFAWVSQQCNLAYEINKNFKSEPEGPNYALLMVKDLRLR